MYNKLKETTEAQRHRGRIIKTRLTRRRGGRGGKAKKRRELFLAAILMK
jgi:hypothetical protein